MKKLTLLLLVALTISCSGGDDQGTINNGGDNGNDNDNPPQPIGIKFTLQQKWKNTVDWGEDKIHYAGRLWCGDLKGVTTPTDATFSDDVMTGFEVHSQNHYCIDTLILAIHKNSKHFDFQITNRNDIRRAPKKIGHIQFVNVDETSNLMLSSSRIKSNTNNFGGQYFPIDYYTSNLEDEIIDQITFDYNSPGCANSKFFNKVDSSVSFRKSTEFTITVPFDAKNNNLQIGMIINNSNDLGAGWDYRFNAYHVIIDKVLVY